MSALRVWYGVTDSDAFRRFRQLGLARSFFQSRTFRHLLVARNYGLSWYATRRNPGRFHDVRTFCLFVGHNKSGTSLLGALLDAHPEVVLSDEVGALRYVEFRFPRDQLFHVLFRGSRSELRKGRVTARRLGPYSYLVPGGWQGRSDRPIVVGDGKSGETTRMLGERPELLDRLFRLMDGVNVKLIQVIRNPFDPISVMMVRGGRTFRNSIDNYFRACDTLVRLRRRVGPDGLLPVRYETFVSDPEGGLTTVCRYLGVEATPEYLSACAAAVRRRPDRSRDMVRWTSPWIELVERRIAEYDFLEGYAYEQGHRHEH